MKSLWPALWLIAGLAPRRRRVNRTLFANGEASSRSLTTSPLTDIPLIWGSEWAFQIDPSEIALSVPPVRPFPNTVGFPSLESFTPACWLSLGRASLSPFPVTLRSPPLSAYKHWCHSQSWGDCVLREEEGQTVSDIELHKRRCSPEHFLFCFVLSLNNAPAKTKSNHFQANTLDWK